MPPQARQRELALEAEVVEEEGEGLQQRQALQQLEREQLWQHQLLSVV